MISYWRTKRKSLNLFKSGSAKTRVSMEMSTSMHQAPVDKPPGL